MRRAPGQSRTFRLSLIALALLGGCATPASTPDQMQQLTQQGRWEESLQLLQKQRESEGNTVAMQAALIGTRSLAVQDILRQGDKARELGRLVEAQGAYERLLRLEPGNERARAGLDAIAKEQQRGKALDAVQSHLQRGNLDAAERALRPVLLEAPQNLRAMALTEALDERRLKKPGGAPPELELPSSAPISLEFRDASLRMVFDAFSRASGVNFVFDRDIKPDAKTTVLLKNASVKEAIDSLLLTNQLEKKVLNANTLFIYPASTQKLKDYQDLVIRNFYLANADAKQTMTLLKTIVKAKDVFIDEKRNTLVMRDTPEAIALAEKLIAAHDQPEPEVMLVVEVLEVKRSNVDNLGLQFPTQIKFSATGTAASGTTAAQPLTIQTAKNLPSSIVNVTGLDPLLAINLQKTLSDANLLANPRIRVRNREKAKIHVGDRVPYSTTTTSATTSLVSQNVTYLDVGLKLEVEPQIYLDDDVMIKVSLEVSSVVKDVPIGNNQTVPQVGTRNASTTLSLKSGETQILAGLIRNDEKLGTNKIPGLGDIPLLGRLFSNESVNAEKTEILLSITPYIVRNLERPAVGLVEYYSGAESQLRVGASGGLNTATSTIGGAGAPVVTPSGGLTLPDPSPTTGAASTSTSGSTGTAPAAGSSAAGSSAAAPAVEFATPPGFAPAAAGAPPLPAPGGP